MQLRKRSLKTLKTFQHFSKCSIFLSVIAKVRHLQDFQLKLSYNMMPSPSGLEIANCLKYFSQVLLSKLEIKYHIIIALFTTHR